jgi:hypothetical protein
MNELQRQSSAGFWKSLLYSVTEHGPKQSEVAVEVAAWKLAQREFDVPWRQVADLPYQARNLESLAASGIV